MTRLMPAEEAEPVSHVQPIFIRFARLSTSMTSLLPTFPLPYDSEQTPPSQII